MFKRRTTTNGQLEDYARRLKLPNFMGVFSRNERLPSMNLKRTGSYIINLDDADGPGTHWVCVCKRDKKYVYFCSYGSMPPDELVNHLKRTGHKKGSHDLVYQTNALQSSRSTACGYYCLKFIYDYTRARKTLYDCVYGDYGFDERANEKVISDWITRML